MRKTSLSSLLVTFNSMFEKDLEVCTHIRITHVDFYLYTHCVRVCMGVCIYKHMPPLKYISFEGSLQ